MDEHDVVIAGAGPTGLMLAAELTLAGVDVAVLERRPSRDIESSRAGGLHSRTIEVLDQRGVADRFLAEGRPMQVQTFAATVMDVRDLPTRHNYGLALWQRDFERILAGWVLDELGVRVRWGQPVVGLAQDGEGVGVELAGGSTVRARWLVGCDGGRSAVRRAAGIEFAGFDATVSFLVAEVAMADEPVLGVRPEGGGIGPVHLDRPGGPYRVVLRDEHVVTGAAPPTPADLRAALVRCYGTDFGVQDPTWISRFDDTTRQAARYRAGRVLLAGDAAHVHAPYGGQGLDTGVQDAVNLGWKLAQVVAGVSPDSLLDTYHDERHPVGTRVLRHTMAQSALLTPDDRHRALLEELGEVVRLDEVRRRIAAMQAALDLCYADDAGDGAGRHPLVGRRLPDLDLETPEGPTRAYALLHEARPLLLTLGAWGAPPPTRRVRVVEATYDGPWELPVLGEVEPPGAVLVRPDGHVCWTGAFDDPDLPAALTTWFGEPAPPRA